ncbi:hypothetical protein H4S08_000537 [Coemansia sp. RSA 1365]|nr:hypothetical protein H4S08_000537 [Coemansia sp. RSA 1365]
MKINKKRRKFTIPLPDDDGSIQPSQPTQNQSTVRITSHGKISAYANYINSALTKASMCLGVIDKSSKQTGNPSAQISLFAEGPAVCKLTTVLEIVKRADHSGLMTTLEIGDATNHPHKPLLDTTQETDDDAQPNKHVRGMYGSKINTNTTPSKEHDKAIIPPDSNRSNNVWMQATLSLASQ